MPGGTVQIEISADGFQTQTFEKQIAAKPLKFELAGTGKLAGTVIDAMTLKPVSQAAVFLLGTPLTAKTDSEGRFEIAGLSQGEAAVAVQAAGYLAEHVDRQLEGAKVVPIRVGLYGAGTLSGRVTAQADGKPLANAQLAVSDLHLSTTTGEWGEFRFEKLPPGEHSLTVSMPGFADSQRSIRAQDAGETLEIALFGNASLKGRVSDAVEKKPLSNVQVRIAGTDLTAKTGEDGRFTVAQIPGRPETVEVVGRGYRQVELPQAFAPGREQTIEVELKGGTILSGKVQDAITNTPLPDAKVEIAGTSQSAQTDADGRFRFEDIAGGPVHLKVTANGYPAGEQDAELKAGEEAVVEIGLTGNARLTGSVVSSNGEQPLKDVLVQVAGSSRKTNTNDKGEFRLENLPARLVELEAVLAGYQPANVSRTLRSGEETRADIALRGAGVLIGSVFSEAGDPLPVAEIRVQGTTAKASPNDAGEFRLDGLMPGEAHVAISAKGFHPVQKTAQVAADKPVSLGEITLEPLKIEAAELTDAFQVPAPQGAIVTEGTAAVQPAAIIPRDDFRTRLERAHAKTGDVEVSLLWNNVNDIDLHVEAPSGEVIYFGHRNSRCGGELDVDMNAGSEQSDEPIENIYWPLHTAPRGKYRVLVHHFANHGAADPTEFRVAVKNGGEVKYYTGKVSPQDKVLVCEFERLTGPVRMTDAELAKAFATPAARGAITTDGTAVCEPAAIIPREDFRTRLEGANGKTGDVQVSLAWDNLYDLELYVRDPCGEVIWGWNKRAQCGGIKDVDANGYANPDSLHLTNTPVENIYWPLGTAPRGKYQVLVKNWGCWAKPSQNDRGQDPTEFRVAVKNEGKVTYYSGKVKSPETVLVCEFERKTGPDPVPIGHAAAPWGLVADGDPHLQSGLRPGNGKAGEPPKKVPPVYNRTDEEAAAERLRLAKSLMDRGITDAAKRWFEDIIERYPHTGAAKQARALLDQLNQQADSHNPQGRGSGGGSGGGTTTTDRRGGLSSSGSTVGDWIYLADLTPLAQNVAGELEPRVVSVAGEPKKHSLWTRTSVPHPPATVEYALGRRYVRLSGAVGIEDSGKADRTRVSTSFQIVGDGKVLWTSDPLLQPGKSQKFAVDVSEVSRLKILTDSNNLPSQYPVWIDPSLVKRQGAE